MPELQTLYLPDKYLAQVQQLLKAYLPHAEVWAYGSRVNGDHFEASDLDLVARFPETALPASVDTAVLNGRSTRDLSAIRSALSESNLPIMVQIVDWASMPPAFRDEILAGYVVLQSGRV